MFKLIADELNSGGIELALITNKDDCLFCYPKKHFVVLCVSGAMVHKGQNEVESDNNLESNAAEDLLGRVSYELKPLVHS